MHLLECLSFYRRAFTEHFFHHSALSTHFQTLLTHSESQIQLRLWQETLDRVAELAARQLSSLFLQYADKPLAAIIPLAQVGANRLADFITQHPVWSKGEVPAIEILLPGLQQGRSGAALL